MKASKIKTDKGQAGMGILLSVVTLLFIMGILIFIFSLMGGELKDATYDATEGDAQLANKTITTGSLVDFNATVTALTNSECSITNVTNQSSSALLVPVGNYTTSSDDCQIRALAIPTAGSESLGNKTVTTGAFVDFSATTIKGLVNCSIVNVTNQSSATLLIPSNNYTSSANGCEVKAVATTIFNNTIWNVTYTYNYGYNAFNNSVWNVTFDYEYDASNTATDVMDDTVNSVGETTSWFSIFLVITAMVVLIFLTVYIINAIKGSGLMDGTA